MKKLFENWRETLKEAPDEMPPEEKSDIFSDVELESAAILNKINAASKGDVALAKEVLDSLIVALQTAAEKL
tara:strand:- start:212 stop:427 length:216 start_codon:yes stop_codon:yes gene_type:complete